MGKQYSFICIILMLVWYCKQESNTLEPDRTDYTTKAIIVEITCAGQVVQLLGAGKNKGQDFFGRSRLTGVQDSSNPADTLYKNCVRLNPVPKDRTMAGDTLEFTYTKVSGFANVCMLGLPVDTLYHVEKLKAFKPRAAKKSRNF